LTCYTGSWAWRAGNSGPSAVSLRKNEDPAKPRLVWTARLARFPKREQRVGKSALRHSLFS